MITWFENLLEQLGSVTFWVELFSSFRALGPLAPILLAFVESLVPVLPLMVIVTFNIGAHGPILGFIYSWVGNFLGSIVVFLFFRYVVKRFLYHRIMKHEAVKRGFEFVAKANQTLLFMVAIFPFTPSSLLNICFGLSDFSQKTYMITIGCAKLFMIFFLTLFGNSFMMAFENPVHLFFSGIVLVLLMLLSRYFSNKSGL